jgi:flagellar protein FliO/FliZ
MAAASAGNLVQTITGLLLVLAALAAFAWAMKRFGPKAQTGAGGLRIVGGLNLGGRERIVLIEVGDQWIVVGASPGRVNALATLPRQETVPPPLSGDKTVPAASFGAWLKQTIEQRNAK